MLALVIVMTMLPVLAIAAGMALFMRRRNNTATLYEDGGLSVPLSAAFGSLRGVGPFAGTHNNFNPLLVLHGDRVEYRVVRRTTVPYAELAGVDISPAHRTPSLILTFTGTGFVFTGKVTGRQALTDALRFLQGKDCPLSAAAREFLATPAAV
ncbi:MAG TPA: hypothetical protein VII91_01265 [Bauldia sp.]